MHAIPVLEKIISGTQGHFQWNKDANAIWQAFGGDTLTNFAIQGEIE